MRGAALVARPAFGVGGVLAVLYWAAGSPVRDVRIVGDSPDFDRVLVAAVGLVAWACALWFGALVVTVTLAAGRGVAGCWAGRLSRRLGPRFMRTAARWIVGATLIAGPLASTPAFAASPSSSSGPNLDRPAAVAPLEAAPHAPASPPTSSGYPTNISLDLDRPMTPYLPPPPVDPKPAASTSDVTLLAGNTHRAEPDDSYVVRRGDTLWDVAARHLGPTASPADIAHEWPRWYAANRAAIGTNPQLILPGTVLHAPAG